MSGYTQTTNELLYAFYGAATVSVPATSPGASLIAGYPPVVVPGGFMSNVGSHSSSLRLKMGGLMTATATVPTWQFGLYATSAQPAAYANTNTLVQSAVFTPGVVTNQPFTIEVEIGLRTLTQIATSTVTAIGEWRSAAGFATPFALTLPTSGAYTPMATWETDLQYFLWPGLTLGAATAGNTITTEYLKLYGEN